MFLSVAYAGRRRQTLPGLIRDGLPTNALVVQVLVSKYADYMTFYRQAQVFTRLGVVLDRSTLTHPVERAAYLFTRNAMTFEETE